MNAKFLEKMKSICKNLGENNKPTYVVMAIAAVKGICRPTFTMMDKKEDPKTKKYTAIREGLTELIAIPVYWSLGKFSAKVATKYLPKELQKKGAKNAMFLGVCLAALFVIPGLCSAAIRPIMDTFYHNDKGLKTPQNKLDVTSSTPEIPLKPVTNSAAMAVTNPVVQSHQFINRPDFAGFTSVAGMKVGGV